MNTLPENSARPSLVFVKLGGSLITDKTRPETVREDVLDRLAGELVVGREARGGGVVVGHGSGSFGHAAAKRHGFDQQGDDHTRPAAIASVQDAAARLHRRVIAALITAGAEPFSIVPGSAFAAAGGSVESANHELLEGVLRAGCLPVVFGDVVLDRDRTASILSTEVIFTALILELLSAGWQIDEILWLGETEGILDPAGRLVRQIAPESGPELLETVGGSAGIDVTGGMRHRLETTLELARLGVSSRVVDGRIPGLLTTALAGESVPGTIVQPATGGA